jgi:osmotically-inducible protein OsmY
MDEKLALLVGCLCLAACSEDEPKRPTTVSTTTVTYATVGSSHRSLNPSFLETDPALTRQVELAIASDRALSLAAKNVDVTVERGLATLRGSLPSSPARIALVSAVRSVPGIVGVHDELTLSPLRDRNDEESDESIAFRLQRRLVSDARIAHEAEKVTIEVVHGTVTLRGTTTSRSTRETMSRVVMETPGAIAVKNELRVRGAI